MRASDPPDAVIPFMTEPVPIKIEGVAPCAPELSTPVEIFQPTALRAPLILSSPHSGRLYPQSFLALSRLSAQQLRRSEDAYVDELFAGAVCCGAPMARALFPRAYLDVNREASELDPAMFEGPLPIAANARSLRVASGLGVIPRIVAESQEIYAGKLQPEDALRRLATLYHPYHETLRRLLTRTLNVFGVAVLLDCHSMPSRLASAKGGELIKADFVIGDRFGASCAPMLARAVERALRGAGFSVQRNKPYAGGFITEHYGAPQERRHALQLEVNRAIYMNEETLEKKPDFSEVRAVLTQVAEALSETARALQPFHLAAE